jgi:hypothetical protein
MPGPIPAEIEAAAAVDEVAGAAPVPYSTTGVDLRGFHPARWVATPTSPYQMRDFKPTGWGREANQTGDRDSGASANLVGRRLVPVADWLIGHRADTEAEGRVLSHVWGAEAGGGTMPNKNLWGRVP